MVVLARIVIFSSVDLVLPLLGLANYNAEQAITMPNYEALLHMRSKVLGNMRKLIRVFRQR